MSTANPHASTDLEAPWADGYAQGVADTKSLFPKPPADLEGDAKATWRDGWKAAKADLKAGVNQSSADPTPAAESTPAPAPTSEDEPEMSSEDRRWVFTIDGQPYDGVTTEEAQKALGRVTATLARRVSYYSDYQADFHQTSGGVMGLIVETVGGFHYPPDAAVWADLTADIDAIKSLVGGGQISEATKLLATTSEAVEHAAEAWNEFLEHFNEGGETTVTALTVVFKASVKIDVVLATIATGGAGAAAGVAVGGGGAGLGEWADQYVEVNEGKKHDLDWTKIRDEALIGAVMAGVGGKISEAWAELLAKYAPAVVGADTAVLSKLSTTFIDNETGLPVTVEALAVKMEPHWGEAVSGLTAASITAALETALRHLSGEPDPDTFAKAVLDNIGDDTWEAILEAILVRIGLTIAE
ncbi:MAG TPA: hypothetical protein VG435_13250 [Acidimicrobiales bacterium]|nr:hypothetical protein [Acidimicrobiales bacterium]